MDHTEGAFVLKGAHVVDSSQGIDRVTDVHVKDGKIAFVGDHPVVHALIHAFNVDGVSNHRCQRFDTLAEARAYTSLPA